MPFLNKVLTIVPNSFDSLVLLICMAIKQTMSLWCTRDAKRWIRAVINPYHLPSVDLEIIMPMHHPPLNLFEVLQVLQ